MKTLRTSIFALVILSVFGLPGNALAKNNGAPTFEDKVVFGGNFNLKSGEVIDGSLIIFGGNVSLEEGSLVEGEVVGFGGNLNIAGEIERDVVVIGGRVSLEKTAVLHHDFIAPGGSVSRSEGAVVEGQYITESDLVVVNVQDIPELNIQTDLIPRPDRFFVHYPAVGDVTGMFFFTFALSALAVIVILFMPKHAERASNAVVAQPVISGSLGLLTAIAVPIILIFLSITVILIPIALLGFILVGLAIAFGWISLGLEVGKRLSTGVNQDWSLPIEAGVGTMILTIVIGAINFIPCFGWIAPTALGAMGLGGVVLTRFGTEEYPAQEIAVEPKPKLSKSSGNKKKTKTKKAKPAAKK